MLLLVITEKSQRNRVVPLRGVIVRFLTRTRLCSTAGKENPWLYLNNRVLSDEQARSNGSTSSF